jgi:hypothetical protein
MSFATHKGSRIIITLLIFYRWNIKWWYFTGVARSLVLFIVVCPFSLTIVLSVIRFTDSDYPFGIFKHSYIKGRKSSNSNGQHKQWWSTQTVMVNTNSNGQHISTKWTIISHLKLLNIKKTMIYVVCNRIQLEIVKKNTYFWLVFF